MFRSVGGLLSAAQRSRLFGRLSGCEFGGEVGGSETVTHFVLWVFRALLFISVRSPVANENKADKSPSTFSFL